MIEVKNISMNYGPVKAVDNVSFDVKKGEILGLLGPNGAGKSTTMKILTTFIVQANGKVTIGGMDTQTDPIGVRNIIGYLPEVAPLCSDMLTYQYLDFVAKARGLSIEKTRERIGWVVEACGLGPVYKKSIIELSRGYRQRVGLAQALIHDPEVLILDEPTSGLDPIQIIDIRNLIKGLARHKTIIFSSHILQEVTSVSDRVVIISEGKIVADGKIHDLEKEAMEENRSHLTVEAAREDVEKGLKSISTVKSFRYLRENGNLTSFEIFYDFEQSLWEDIDGLVKKEGWRLKSYADKPITFEETFIKLTQRADSQNMKQRSKEI